MTKTRILIILSFLMYFLDMLIGGQIILEVINMFTVIITVLFLIKYKTVIEKNIFLFIQYAVLLIIFINKVREIISFFMKG